MTDEAVFSEAFAGLAVSNVARGVVEKWDPSLRRDPRLLVPVDVQALRVPPGASVEHALVGVTTLERVASEAPPADEPRSPAPFTDDEPRPPGVYLHWALPDGLTQGVVREEEGASELRHRPLPNRWLVVRLEQGNPRPFTAWVVEADRARTVPLAAWSEQPGARGGRTPDLPPSGLTATVGGDPAWAAVFDNVVDRFAVYDDLSGMAGQLPLSYLVVGWYSDPTLDPLDAADVENGFHALLADLGWTVREEDLARLQEEARSRANAQGEVGLISTHPVSGTEARIAGTGRKAAIPAFDVGRRIPEAGEVILQPQPWWPRQSLYHGAVHGVGAEAADQRPNPGAVHMALGPTAAESLAALHASRLTGGGELGERLHTALQCGLLESFDRPDGIPLLEEEMHRRSFESMPGGVAEEWVRVGDQFAGLKGHEKPHRVSDGFVSVVETAEGGGPTKAGVGKAVFDFVAGSYQETLAIGSARGGAVSGAADPVRMERVERPKPRLFYPQDPVVTIQGLNRSLRHGYDGRFEPDETVACRISGTAVRRLLGLVDGADLLAGGLDHGGIPVEAEDLLQEAALEDPFGLELAAQIAKQLHPELTLDSVRRRLRAEDLLVKYSAMESADMAPVAVHSLKEGTIASPLARTEWRQPWVPLYLEWELGLSVEDAGSWTLGELDFDPPESFPPAAATLGGRSLLNSAASKAFAARVSDFLAEEERRDQRQEGLISESDEAVLSSLGNIAWRSDTLGAAFDGLREHLLGFDSNEAITEPEEGESVTPVVLPERSPLLLRGGHAVLTRARVVDAFGRTLELPVGTGVILAESLDPEGAIVSVAGTPFLLPSRLTAPARLWFRFIDASDPATDSSLDERDPEPAHSPIAAWLLPDHVDHALELFDPKGEPLGQLRHESLGRGVVWEGSPGRPGPIGAPPGPELGEHPRWMARELVARDAAERGAGIEDRESPLHALLRVIDTTLWTVDPFGQAGTEHLSLITGHPIAMVRARLTMEVRSDVSDLPGLDAQALAERVEAFERLSQHVFEVRLGALTRTEDGLLGYFVGDDYRHFYPVHHSVLSEALPSGPGKGFQGPAGQPPDMTPEEIRSPYVVPDPTIEVRPGETVFLTLLLTPGGKVHATSGILPRKSIALPRDYVKQGLERLSPSFRVGPVLVDPTTIRMPHPAALPKEQVWTRRVDPLSWRDDPLVAATQDAILPDTSAVAQEGYIRVRFEQPGVGPT